MREPPRKLDVRERPFNNDCFNVRIFLRGKELKDVISYDQDEGFLWRCTGQLNRQKTEFGTIQIHFKPEEFRVEWVDSRKVENANLHTDERQG